MRTSHFHLTPCTCPKHRLTRRQLWLFGVSMLGMVIVIEGGCAIHFFSAGDTAASVMIFGAWLRDLGKEIVKHLIEDV